ncbi:hypothetical protein [Magnetovibrio blakemorei]|uniref:Uncharacterized protein n=1 Tax=Magnetovibrio blakemorei TaxID=28181 RepID=A0A1E5QBW6_9PROT|nr:hypothetical protein [Magnetovibrio blakemorei]OEJ69507.1 hypothetical protein BEN30_02855 [Magnetovibrio blakemorei]
MASLNANTTGLGALLRGEMSLKRAFWLWGGVGCVGQLVAISTVMLALSDAVDDFVGWAILAWIGFLYFYFIVVLVGIWRVSGRILASHKQAELQGEQQGEHLVDSAPREQKSAARAARVMVLLGALTMVAVTVQVLFIGGSPH